MLEKYRNQSVGFQLKLVITLCLVIAFSSIAALVYRNASGVLLESTLREHQSKVESMAKPLPVSSMLTFILLKYSNQLFAMVTLQAFM